MYYNIEVIININIEFIVIVVNITQYPIRNNACILVLNSDPDSHFYPGCAEQAQNWFLNLLKIKYPQQANTGKFSRNAVVSLVNQLSILGCKDSYFGVVGRSSVEI